jgi:hypothetical protein
LKEKWRKETLVLDAITYSTFPKLKEENESGCVLRSARTRPTRPTEQSRIDQKPLKERGIVTHVAHVEVEVEATVVTAIGSVGLDSSVRGGNAGSTLLRGGEFMLGKLAVESVGELVDCDGARGGVEFEPVVCVWANFARLLV